MRFRVAGMATPIKANSFRTRPFELASYLRYSLVQSYRPNDGLPLAARADARGPLETGRSVGCEPEVSEGSTRAGRGPINPGHLAAPASGRGRLEASFVGTALRTLRRPLSNGERPYDSRLTNGALLAIAVIRVSALVRWLRKHGLRLLAVVQ